MKTQVDLSESKLLVNATDQEPSGCRTYRALASPENNESSALLGLTNNCNLI